MLVAAEPQQMIVRAQSAPAHLGYFLRVCARTCADVTAEEMPSYDVWVANIVYPALKKLQQW